MAQQQKTLPSWAKFACGGLGGMTGWLFVHPFDTLKVRMQLLSEGGKKLEGGALKQMLSIVKSEKVPGMYRGLSAALMRQATYTTIRLGLYDVVREAWAGSLPPSELPFYKKASIGLLAGAIASFACCPVEVSLVRMQADGRLPVADRRGYKNVFNALYRIGAEEGAATYFRGATPTVARAMVVCMTQVAMYDQMKTVYKNYLGMKDGVPLHFAGALSAGLIYSYCSLPLDTAKTRMQNQVVSAEGKLMYRSIPQTLGMIAKQEGPTALWRGFSSYFARSGGHTVFMFLCLEQYRKLFRHMLNVQQ
eukprot:TRINITY_DN8131_c0_g1_i1.p1 TRINITY_DN8131_c0_g1~~TRINITY_DN8131_c0_g1_i1.p1  ORF type:complete len:306 (+),score=83.23 TRINITY_DN8131_c0_g1_i1:261-1178(+)